MSWWDYLNHWVINYLSITKLNVCTSFIRLSRISTNRFNSFIIELYDVGGYTINKRVKQYLTIYNSCNENNNYIYYLKVV
jgi:hypothetical protein